MRNILETVLIGLMLTDGGGTVRAGPFDDGVAAYQRGDFATALRLFRPLAEQGNASAQSSLGLMYSQGQGIAQDFHEALKWYRLGAEQGNASAQSSLGLMYAQGRGLSQDLVRDHMWSSLAASKLSGDDAQLAARRRDTIQKGLSPAQLVRAQEMARQCEARKFKGCD
jgi:TPR repeat protein